jgi:hypothetical protein
MDFIVFRENNFKFFSDLLGPKTLNLRFIPIYAER